MHISAERFSSGDPTEIVASKRAHSIPLSRLESLFIFKHFFCIMTLYKSPFQAVHWFQSTFRNITMTLKKKKHTKVTVTVSVSRNKLQHQNNPLSIQICRMTKQLSSLLQT